MYGERIKNLRKENNLRQVDLAKLLNISQSAMAKYEKEQLEPNIVILKKLSDIFLCSVDYIIGRESEDNVIVIDSATMQSENELILLKNFRQMSSQEQKKLLEYILQRK